MSNFNILSVREMIDMAFGDSDVNIVNFKIIQTILYLLARQLRVLERRVEVNLDPSLSVASQSSITVTEIKMHAAVPKKKKRTEGKITNKEHEVSVAGKTLKQLDDNKEIKRFKNIDEVIPFSEKRPLDKSEPLSNKPESKTKDNVSTEQIFERDSGHKTYQKDYHRLLEIIEEQREQELRVIRQRANSREEAEKSPTPMTSLDSLVERLPSEEAKAISGQSNRGKTRKLSVVTQDQFQALTRVVEDLQNRFGEICSAYLPENIELMQELHKGASLTDAMAALQLSARLDAAEKTLYRMSSLITDLASRTPGIDVTVKYEGHTGEQTMGNTKPMQFHYKKSQKVASETQPYQAPTTNTTHVDVAESEKDITASKDKKWITSYDLDCTLQELQEDILKEVTNITHTNIESANSALKLAKRLETKLETTLHLQSRMNDLETLVSDYADHINILDTGLTSQITNYQEQLTQMQHDLETCLENMAEALANTGGDAAAVAELNAHFTNLQENFDKASIKQKELQEMQNSLHLDLKTLWQQIEQLRDTKPDREEVSDALRDKAGLKALNGLVSQQHFDAVRGDFEKSIGAAYEKFNNQELIWQKAIDEIFRELNEKADWIQMNSLRDDINKNIEMLNSRIQTMIEILGEPRAAATTRKMFRDAACLSCASPANMEPTGPNSVPKLPAFTNTLTKHKLEAEAMSKLNGDGDYDICYPGRPIPHPIDSRSQFCHRYCGGISGRIAMKRSPININPNLRVVSTGIGSDGKTYIIEELDKPCMTCNKSDKVAMQLLNTDQAPEKPEVNSFEINPSEIMAQEKSEDYRSFDKDNTLSVTPTLLLDDEDI